MTYNEGLERQVIELIAADRLHIPVSSMNNKLQKMKPKLAKAIVLPDEETRYAGDRVYARIESKDTMKARGMKEAMVLFGEQYPRHGKILEGMIEEERAKRETHLYFGVQEGSRLTDKDYMGVMGNLGFSEVSAQNLYPILMGVSRNMSKKREEERSVLIGGKED